MNDNEKSEEIKKKWEELNTQKNLAKLVACVTGDEELWLQVEIINFQDIIYKIVCNSGKIEKHKAKELANVFQQLRKMLEDYIKENNIELGGE